MRSVYDAIKSAVSLVPATRTADATGSVVDTAGYNSAKLVVAAGALDNADNNETYVVKVQEGNLADGSDAVDVPGLSITLDRVADDNTVKNLRIEGLGTSRKRYLRAVLNVGGTTPSAAISAVFELGRAYSEPVQ
jgi:hypothetical protein